MKKNRTKLTVMGLMAAMCVSSVFTGCGAQSGKAADNDVEEQVAESSSYTLSEAFGKYRLWYDGCEDPAENKKNSRVSVYLIEDGKIKDITYGRAESNGDSILTLGEIAEMTDEEIIEYYSVYPERYAVMDLSPRIVTDGSGNSTELEYLAHPGYYMKLDDDGKFVTDYDSLHKGERKYRESFQGLNIYDAWFSGVTGPNASLFTRVDDSSITFTLDTPDTEGIQVD